MPADNFTVAYYDTVYLIEEHHRESRLRQSRDPRCVRRDEELAGHVHNVYGRRSGRSCAHAWDISQQGKDAPIGRPDQRSRILMGYQGGPARRQRPRAGEHLRAGRARAPHDLQHRSDREFCTRAVVDAGRLSSASAARSLTNCRLRWPGRSPWRPWRWWASFSWCWSIFPCAGGPRFSSF